MIVEVTKDNVLITGNSVINAAEVCVNKCKFKLPDCFNDLVVTAVFNGIPVPLVNGECFVPSLEKGNAVLGVYAYKENSGSVELMYSPKPTGFYVFPGSYSDEINGEAIPQISQYEQYCKMIAEEYEELESSLEKSEELRAAAEAQRKNTFEINEKLRQTVFEANEDMRNAEFNGEYTNLLKNVTEEATSEDDNKDTSFPAQYPCRKTGAWYSEWENKLKAKAGNDVFIIEVNEGERFNISDYFYTNINTYIADESWAKIKAFSQSTSKDLAGGIYAMPENAKYLILHSPTGSVVPHITKVSDPVIATNDITVSNAQKFIAPQVNGDNHLGFYGVIGGALEASWMSNTSTYVYTKGFASGIYPLESGKEYMLCYNESVLPQYAFCGYICSEDFTINTIIQYENYSGDCVNLDECKRYIFTATENDKYIALNCFDFNSNIQFGESRAEGSQKMTKIGNAVFDGKNDITLGDIGGIDRSLADRKWISFGDSITYGSGVNSGEKRWQNYIIDRYHIGSHINMGIGSTSIGYRDGETYPAMCTDERLNILIAENPDIVTILGGANDISYDIPIGTDEDIKNKNRYTFKGAYAYIIDKILSAKSDTTIVLLGMYHCMKVTYTGMRTHTLEEYAIATKDVAEHFGLPFVDLNECGFNSYNFNDTGGVYSADGIHPNAEGTKRVAMVVSRWFDTFKGTIY